MGGTKALLAEQPARELAQCPRACGPVAAPVGHASESSSLGQKAPSCWKSYRVQVAIGEGGPRWGAWLLGGCPSLLGGYPGRWGPLGISTALRGSGSRGHTPGSGQLPTSLWPAALLEATGQGPAGPLLSRGASAACSCKTSYRAWLPSSTLSQSFSKATAG